ncbi:LuxR family two component transcriptional regulator [Micromonospora pisi]|uniref:LuxR family two component transcriptional regulator n=1 Tax=Micromonospora pisi TaxID=589240 RepID=A0A495JBD5_9ACTN|nr:response regulator transcription factor [Micromonospora pisi]RKR86051.1 LuxR family two component transcriptional regulator [Micromonospora pisi]
MIRVLIVEEMGLLRGALRMMLASEDDLEVVADLAPGADIVSVVRRERPDVVLIDIELADVDPLAVLRQLGARARGSAVLALTGRRCPQTLQAALRAGVRGFVDKNLPPTELLRLVRLVAAGERVIDPATAVAALSPPVGPLTDREREVLRAAAEGLPLREIACRLYLAYGTVRNHLTVILRKTGARNRLEAVRRAQRDGWL